MYSVTLYSWKLVVFLFYSKHFYGKTHTINYYRSRPFITCLFVIDELSLMFCLCYKTKLISSFMQTTWNCSNCTDNQCYCLFQRYPSKNVIMTFNLWQIIAWLWSTMSICPLSIVRNWFNPSSLITCSIIGNDLLFNCDGRIFRSVNGGNNSHVNWHPLVWILISNTMRKVKLHNEMTHFYYPVS